MSFVSMRAASHSCWLQLRCLYVWLRQVLSKSVARHQDARGSSAALDSLLPAEYVRRGGLEVSFIIC